MIFDDFEVWIEKPSKSGLQKSQRLIPKWFQTVRAVFDPPNLILWSFFLMKPGQHTAFCNIYIYTVYIIFISNHTKSTWNTIEVHKFHKFTCLYILSHYPFHLFSCLAGFPVREILTTNRTSSAKINTCDSRWQPIFKRNHDEAIKPIWDIVETMALTSW